MNKILLTFLIMTFFVCAFLRCTESKLDFTVINFNLDDSIESKKFNEWTAKNIGPNSNSDCKLPGSLILWDTISSTKCFYEDEQYQVFGTNHGEWGGTIVFKDKSSEFSYLLNCSDLLMVNHQNNAYYITDVVADSNFGRTRILRIENPKELIKIPTKYLPRNITSRDSIIRANTVLLKEIRTKITLLDTSNVIASLFYPYRGNNYLIYSAKHDDYIQFDEIDTTFLGEIVDRNLAAIDTILPLPTWTLEFKPNRVYNEVYSYNYNRKHWRGEHILFIDSNGSIYIKEDTIVIGYRYYDKRQRVP